MVLYNRRSIETLGTVRNVCGRVKITWGCRIFDAMNAPPVLLDTFQVVSWTTLGPAHTATGNARHNVGGTVLETWSAFAICREGDGESCYLFRCDPDWAVRADTWHASISEAKAQAEFEYSGVATTWHDVT